MSEQCKHQQISSSWFSTCLCCKRRAQDIINEQRERISTLEEAQRWIPVIERLPEPEKDEATYDDDEIAHCGWCGRGLVEVNFKDVSAANFETLPPDPEGCKPLRQLTESDVRRIVKDELKAAGYLGEGEGNE